MIDESDTRPTLKAIILDFSSVNNVDVTSVQYLIDVRNQLDRYASPDIVEWHFATINNRWTKRALASAGFGYPTRSTQSEGETWKWKPIFSVADIGGSDSAAADAEWKRNDQLRRSSTRPRDVEAKGQDESIARPAGETSDEDSLERQIASAKGYATVKQAVVQGVNRPFFHADLTSALQSAIANVESQSKAGPEATGPSDGDNAKI